MIDFNDLLQIKDILSQEMVNIGINNAIFDKVKKVRVDMMDFLIRCENTE
jgi:hypothetical protein